MVNRISQQPQLNDGVCPALDTLHECQTKQMPTKS